MASQQPTTPILSNNTRSNSNNTSHNTILGHPGFSRTNQASTKKVLTAMSLGQSKTFQDLLRTGEGGIRTHGRFFKRFRVVRFRPLSHLSRRPGQCTDQAASSALVPSAGGTGSGPPGWAPVQDLPLLGTGDKPQPDRVAAAAVPQPTPPGLPIGQHPPTPPAGPQRNASAIGAEATDGQPWALQLLTRQQAIDRRVGQD